MQEVLKKVDELYTLLDSKVVAYDKKIAELDSYKSELDDRERIQKATQNNLDARSRIIEKYEDFDAEKKKLVESIARNTKIKQDNDVLSNKLIGIQDELKKKEEELDKMIELYKKKDQNVEAMKVELKEKEKNLKDKILEEIKGKL